MLKESVTFNTARYDAGFGFIVDIEDVVDENGNSVWDVWLYRSGYNIKLYMFGLPITPHMMRSIAAATISTVPIFSSPR